MSLIVLLPNGASGHLQAGDTVALRDRLADNVAQLRAIPVCDLEVLVRGVVGCTLEVAVVQDGQARELVNRRLKRQVRDQEAE